MKTSQMKIYYQNIKEKKGQSVLEYIILTSLIGIFCLVGIKQFGERLKTRIKQMNQQIEKHISIR